MLRQTVFYKLKQIKYLIFVWGPHVVHILFLFCFKIDQEWRFGSIFEMKMDYIWGHDVGSHQLK